MNYDEMEKEDMIFLQKNLKDLRRLTETNICDLADYLGISRQHVNNIEKGSVKLKKVMYLAMLEYFRNNEEKLQKAEELILYIRSKN